MSAVGVSHTASKDALLWVLTLRSSWMASHLRRRMANNFLLMKEAAEGVAPRVRL